MKGAQDYIILIILEESSPGEARQGIGCRPSVARITHFLSKYAC